MKRRRRGDEGKMGSKEMGEKDVGNEENEEKKWVMGKEEEMANGQREE